MKNRKSNFSGKHGPLLIAEIGGNHEGDKEYALRLTELAIDSGVDYVKYQLYSGDSLVSREESPIRNKHFEKFELEHDFYIQLARRCEQAGVGFMASVWNPEYIEWIDPYLPIYKIGSGDLTAYTVIKSIVKLRKPIILSTGLSTLEEVINTVEYIQNLDGLYKDPDFLSILQCTSMYPIPDGDAHLAVMNTYKSLTGLTVGYSDHTLGSYALEIAVAMGAQILEFHFTDSREGKTFRDHQVSLTQIEVLDLIKNIDRIKNLSGRPMKRPLKIEGDHRTSFRRAVYPQFDLPKGTIITADKLITLRPNHGIDARNINKLIGKKTKIELKAHQKLNWEYFS